MYQCVITSIIHTNTEYVTFISADDFAPGKYSAKVDTISLVTMTHTIYFIA